MSKDLAEPDNLFVQNLPPDLVIGPDPTQPRLLREYGAVFVARNVRPPNKVVFEDEAEVAAFQSQLETAGTQFGEFFIELQQAALNALVAAREEAQSGGLSISPRGADSGRRDYAGTVELWKSRVEPALTHWVGIGRLKRERAEAIRSLSPYDQVAEIFALEADGIYFAKDPSKSIIYSVAPPGASQHLSLLAFDVAEFADRAVREILELHFWYQTVASDLPHFTFLGVGVDELHALGLKRITSHDRHFWVPDF